MAPVTSSGNLFPIGAPCLNALSPVRLKCLEDWNSESPRSGDCTELSALGMKSSWERSSQLRARNTELGPW